jgi:hypothetical protein
VIEINEIHNSRRTSLSMALFILSLLCSAGG